MQGGGRGVHLLWKSFSSLFKSSNVEAVSSTRPDTFLCTCSPCGRCRDAGYARGTQQTGAIPYKVMSDWPDKRPSAVICRPIGGYEFVCASPDWNPILVLRKLGD